MQALRSYTLIGCKRGPHIRVLGLSPHGVTLRNASRKYLGRYRTAVFASSVIPSAAWLKNGVTSCVMEWPGNLRELEEETRMNPASIFDLSPSEKLQLVEDLWDDLGRAGGHTSPRLAKAGTGAQEIESPEKPGAGAAMGRGEGPDKCPLCPLSWRSLLKPSWTLPKPTPSMKGAEPGSVRSS